MEGGWWNVKNKLKLEDHKNQKKFFLWVCLSHKKKVKYKTGLYSTPPTHTLLEKSSNDGLSDEGSDEDSDKNYNYRFHSSYYPLPYPSSNPSSILCPPKAILLEIWRTKNEGRKCWIRTCFRWVLYNPDIKYYDKIEKKILFDPFFL